MAKRRGLSMPVPEQGVPAPAQPRREGFASVVPTVGVEGWALEGAVGVFQLEGGRLLMGRQEPGNTVDIAVEDGSVSRQHAELLAVPDGWLVRDLGSTNGTMVGGALLEVGEARAVGDGDVVKCGNAVFVFRRIRAP